MHVDLCDADLLGWEPQLFRDPPRHLADAAGVRCLLRCSGVRVHGRAVYLSRADAFRARVLAGHVATVLDSAAGEARALAVTRLVGRRRLHVASVRCLGGEGREGSVGCRPDTTYELSVWTFDSLLERACRGVNGRIGGWAWPDTLGSAAGRWIVTQLARRAALFEVLARLTTPAPGSGRVDPVRAARRAYYASGRARAFGALTAMLGV